MFHNLFSHYIVKALPQIVQLHSHCFVIIVFININVIFFMFISYLIFTILQMPTVYDQF